MNRRPMRQAARYSLALMLTLAVAACADRNQIRLSYDSALSERIAEVGESNGEEALATLLPEDWDEVHVFGACTTDTEIEEEIGAPMIGVDPYGELGILILVRDGRPVRGVAVGGPYFDAGGLFSREVVIRSESPDHSGVEFVEPRRSGAATPTS